MDPKGLRVYNQRPGDFAMLVDHSDMEPMFHNGDYLLCEYCDSINHGELGVFEINGQKCAKQLYLKRGECRLVSLNLDTPDVVVKSLSDLKCIGRILGSAKIFEELY